MFRSVLTSAALAGIYLAAAGRAEVGSEDGFDTVLAGSGVSVSFFYQ